MTAKDSGQSVEGTVVCRLSNSLSSFSPIYRASFSLSYRAVHTAREESVALVNGS